MGGRKKLTNNTGIPQHRIEAIARCILPDIQTVDKPKSTVIFHKEKRTSMSNI